MMWSSHKQTYRTWWYKPKRTRRPVPAREKHRGASPTRQVLSRWFPPCTSKMVFVRAGMLTHPKFPPLAPLVDLLSGRARLLRTSRRKRLFFSHRASVSLASFLSRRTISNISSPQIAERRAGAFLLVPTLPYTKCKCSYRRFSALVGT